MPDSPPPEADLSTPADDDIFVPAEDDHDPEAAEQMRQGKEHLDPENALYDPYFENARAAQEWDGISEFAPPPEGSER